MSEAGVETGHNSNGQLKAIIERINRLEDEKQQAVDDIKDVYAEAKANGHNVAAIRSIIRSERRDPEKVKKDELLEAEVHAMMAALGMLP